jgi:hypothetical protein
MTSVGYISSDGDSGDDTIYARQGVSSCRFAAYPTHRMHDTGLVELDNIPQWGPRCTNSVMYRKNEAALTVYHHVTHTRGFGLAS